MICAPPLVCLPCKRHRKPCVDLRDIARRDYFESLYACSRDALRLLGCREVIKLIIGPTFEIGEAV